MVSDRANCNFRAAMPCIGDARIDEACVGEACIGEACVGNSDAHTTLPSIAEA